MKGLDRVLERNGSTKTLGRGPEEERAHLEVTMGKSTKRQLINRLFQLLKQI